MKRIGVLTSGGDAPGMNAAVRAVVRGAIFNEMQVYGIFDGYEGLMNGEIEELGRSSVSDIIHRGGTILRSSRSPKFKTPEGTRRAIEQAEKFGLEGIVVIGGDGSFRGSVNLLRGGIVTVGVPGTIDNDLGYTDETIGFDTAVNTVVSLLGNIRDTTIAHGCATVVEVMGRNCGDIALRAGLAAGAESILIPEVPYDIDAICDKMIAGKKRGKHHSIIMKAEGVDIPTPELAHLLEERTGIKTRTVIPAYIQRGGSPTAFDRLLASRLGYKAVELLRDDVRGVAVGVRGEEIIVKDIEEAIDSKNKPDLKNIELASILSI
ncbi:MAG: ATP-dependent 6-phosphofructokinase [Anaerovoracaceae bacterium]|nr:ATP-dependent 6-phosphofructokinase [Bacillota bacterium]MDY2670603.1 ATP-dependent 6-phosphofructokinase [Anaerovoracaceae bacterium]